MRCPHCAAEIPETARFCPSCGAMQSSASQAPTAVASPTGAATSPAAESSRSPSQPRGRFTAGQVLASRYRIIGLLGRGGMGEVYRADDLKLDHPVSLKFLPARLAHDPVLLERLLAEVRMARQVSHPNVCRVYDLGEIDGQHFITMEYVDGEDLASLLRRIGRLPKSKADEVARQICAGLAAAHDRGVLHRDLKPSNVMIDGDGRVRITDFGLAARAGDESQGEIGGTPAYMAPEQFEGKPATIQSDLYSLGMVLYEMYTGRRVFEAASLVEWKARHTGAAPTSPSEVAQDIDAAAERAILRCLEKDPSRRPSSALQLAAALPGGDPLAAALAAGETPSPEMVAAAGGEGAVSLPVAGSLLGGVALAIALVIAIAPFSTDLGLARLTKSPELIRASARETVAQLGYDPDPIDWESWFVRDYEPLRYLAERKPGPEWRADMRAWGPPLLLHYRQSPQRMVPLNLFSRVEDDDPIFELSGSVIVAVDGLGRLVYLKGMPPQLDTLAMGTTGAMTTPGATASSAAIQALATDWDALFRRAGLDRTKFAEVPSRWVPPVAFDERREWTGVRPWAPDIPARVTAAAWHGRPVYFDLHGPWSQPLRMVVARRIPTRDIATVSSSVLILVLMVMAGFLSRRNIKRGLGDRRGAWRIALFLLLIRMVAWAASAHHVADFSHEFQMSIGAFGPFLAESAFFGVLYLTIEPFMRRRMPELLIGWARVLDGRLRDPRVGRDILIGGLMGSAVAALFHVENALPAWFSLSGQTTVSPNYNALAGGRHLVGFFASVTANALVRGLFVIGLYFLLRILLRRPAFAAIALAIIFTLVTLGAENARLETAFSAMIGIVVTILVARFGLLPAVSFGFFREVVQTMPLPFDFSSAYTTQSIIILIALTALALYAFRISLGSRQLMALPLGE